LFDLGSADARLDDYVRRLMAATNIPGIALAITDRQRTLRVATYGYANLDARTPITADMLFQPGSIDLSGGTLYRVNFP
jgi:CubicO group peptidase (beta-lactamase class C family)